MGVQENPRLPPRRSPVGHKQPQGWGMGFGMARTDFWGLAGLSFWGCRYEQQRSEWDC